MPRRRKKLGRRVLITLLVLVLLAPVAMAVGVLVFVDPNAWRPEIEAAVHRATGRDLRVGRLSLVPSLSPTLGASDIALANLPGGSRPEMLTVARAEVKLALLPLLAGRVEIARLLLVRPDILLEHDAAGRPNWRFAAPPSAGSAAPAATAARRSGPEILVRALRIEDGHLTWRGSAGEPPRSVDLHALEAAADGMEAPVTLTGQGAYAGQTLALSAETGPLARLLDAAATTPWPVKATLETPGARLTATGAATHPMQAAGYTLAVEGAAANLSALDGLTGAHLPPLRQVAFAARAVDGGGTMPDVTGIVVRAGGSDLDRIAAGLKLTHAELSAASLNEPMRVEADGTLRGTPLRVTASLGPAAVLLAAAPGAAPYPVELAGTAAGATLAVKGGIAAPGRMSGIDLAVTGRIPDLSALGPLAGTNLPALRPVTLDARVGDRDGVQGFAIRGLAVTAPEADVSGELVVGLGGRPSLQATLASRRIDLDAVLAAMPAGGAVAPAAPPVRAATPPAAPPPPPLPKRARRLIPDDPLPLGLLDDADADLHLAVGEFRSGGVAYRDLAARLSLRDGRLVLDPVVGTLPGGRTEMKLSIDSHATPPPVALSVRAPGLALKPLLSALRLPDDVSGTVELDADLHGAGATTQALAAGLGGRLGVAMTDGELDNRLLGAALGPVFGIARTTVDALGLDHPGRTSIHCLALRADAEGGIVTIGTVLVDTGKVLVHGGGTVNLRDEGIQLRLRPMIRGSVPVVIPVRVGGTLLDPKIGNDPSGTAGAIAGLAARLGGKDSPLAGMAAVVAGERRGDACGPALAAARSGARPASAPGAGPGPAAPAPAAPRAPNAGDILRGLLSR